MSQNGKTVLVIGGGTGIGESCALMLAGEGFQVAVAGRRLEKLKSVAEQFQGENSIDCQTVDVSDRQSVARLIDWATSKWGQIDVMVNCAGVNVAKRTMTDLAPEDWDKLININATGAYNCMYAVLPQMRERQDGLIVNISSVAGIRAALLGGVAYNASKFAMTALGISVGQEEKDHGIRITNIYPGEVETPILDERPVPVTAEHRARILQPTDVAETVLMVVKLPPRANVPELTIKPTTQAFC